MTGDITPKQITDLIEQYKERKDVSSKLFAASGCTGPVVDATIEIIQDFITDLEDLLK